MVGSQCYSKTITENALQEEEEVGRRCEESQHQRGKANEMTASIREAAFECFSWDQGWDKIWTQSPYLHCSREDFKTKLKHEFPGESFVDLHVGQVLHGHGSQVCGLLGVYLGIQIFSVLEQGKGTARMMVLHRDALKLLQLVAKRAGMHHQGAPIPAQDIPIHLLCLDDGLYFCRGSSALAEVVAIKQSRYRAVVLPNSTCDVTISHSTQTRLANRRQKRTPKPPVLPSVNSTEFTRRAPPPMYVAPDHDRAGAMPHFYHWAEPTALGYAQQQSGHSYSFSPQVLMFQQQHLSPLHKLQQPTKKPMDPLLKCSAENHTRSLQSTSSFYHCTSQEELCLVNLMKSLRLGIIDQTEDDGEEECLQGQQQNVCNKVSKEEPSVHLSKVVQVHVGKARCGAQ